MTTVTEFLAAYDLTPIEVAAPIVALVALYVHLRLRRKDLGPEADWWEDVRRLALPQLNRLARRHGFGYAAYHLSPAEYVGMTPLDPEAVEEALWEHGYTRMWLAAFKFAPDGRGEVGSWAFRTSILSTRQTHVMLFAREDGGTDVYAHNEFNAFNPAVAALHYLGVDYRPLGGEGIPGQLLVGLVNPENVLD